MKHLQILVFLGVAVSVMTAARFPVPNGESGKSLFIANKCMNCHAIESQGIARAGTPPPAGAKQPPDLSAVGEHHTSSWMQQWLMKEETMNGKKHLKKFGGSADELAVLTNWLASLKGGAKSIAQATKPTPRETHAVTTPVKTLADSVQINWNLLADSATGHIMLTLDTIYRYYANDTLFISDLKTSQQRWQEYIISYLTSIYPRDGSSNDSGVFRKCCRTVALPLIQQREKDLRGWLGEADSNHLCLHSSIKSKTAIELLKK